MIASEWSNYPGGREPVDPASEMALVATGGDVRELQRTLPKVKPKQVERLYVYQWKGGDSRNPRTGPPFDSGLLKPQKKPRPRDMFWTFLRAIR